MGKGLSRKADCGIAKVYIDGMMVRGISSGGGRTQAGL